MTDLAQAYVHFQSTKIGKRIFQENSSEISYALTSITRSVYGESVTVVVEAGEGSLRVWATLVGTIYGAIAMYPDFRAGIAAAYRDAATFGEYANKYIREKISPHDEKYIIQQSRKKVPGQILRLLRRIDKLNAKSSRLPHGKLNLEMQAIKRDLDRVLANIDDQSDRMMLIRHIKENSLYLPFLPDLPLEALRLPKVILRSGVLDQDEDRKLLFFPAEHRSEQTAGASYVTSISTRA